MDLDLVSVLRRFWHPVATLGELAATEDGRGPLAVRLLGENLVVVRLDDGVRVLRDRCLHRAVRMSTGWVAPAADGSLALHCPYHGWQWDGDGRCVGIPSVPEARSGWGLPSRRIAAYEATERHGLIWVRPEAGWPTQLPDGPPIHDPAFVVTAGEPRAVASSLDRWVGQILAVSTESGPCSYVVTPPGTVEVRRARPAGDRVLWAATSPVDVGMCRTFWFADAYPAPETDGFLLPPSPAPPDAAGRAPEHRASSAAAAYRRYLRALVAADSPEALARVLAEPLVGRPELVET